MAWYYVEAGARKGPLDDTAFLELVTSGAIKAETLVWREGMKDWIPYATVAGGPAQGAPPPLAAGPSVAGGVPCAECGRSVPAGETVSLGGRVVCATCKPAVVQRMIEGTSSGVDGFDPEEMLTDLRSRGGYDLDIGSVVSRSWDVVKGNFWPCLGVSLLIMVILAAAGQVPCIGIIVTLLATGPLMGGLFYYFLLQVRGQPATVNEAFAGFRSPVAKELLLAGLVQQLVQIVVALVMIIPLFASGLLLNPGAMDPVFPSWIFVTMPFVVLAIFFLYMIWYPSYVIIADTGIGFWKGMELSRRLVQMRLFTWVGLILTMVLIALAGIVALCVGFLVALPVINTMFAVAWDEIREQAEEVRQARVGGAA